MKLSGKRSAGKSHAAFDVAGDGNRINNLITAPLLDPTLEEGSAVMLASYSI